MQLTKEQKNFLNKVVSRTYTLKSEGKIDVDGNVDMTNMNLTKIPVKFGRVDGFFNCQNNNLTSLEGCPDEVGAGFYCRYNNLTSLEFAPSKVGGGFYCYGNNLTECFKNIKEDDFKHWDRLDWSNIIEEYPFLINIAKNYINKEDFIGLIKYSSRIKLYLR
jgi:hypothetical protein